MFTKDLLNSKIDNKLISLMLEKTHHSSSEFLGRESINIFKEPFIDVINFLEFDILDQIQYLTKVNKVRVLKSDAADFIPFLKHLEGLAKTIENIFNSVAETETDIKAIAAGSDEMEQFKHLNIIDGLSAGDVTKWNDVSNLPFDVIITKLKMNKIQNKIQKNYSRL